MGYTVYLRVGGIEGDVAKVPRHTEGSVFPLGGHEEAQLGITFNYYPQFNAVLLPDGLRCLHGKVATETILLLEEAVATLGVVRDKDYWAATDGNAGYALNVLLGWARLHPHAVWDVL